MSDEYQLRKDVDRIYGDIYTLQGKELDVYKKEDVDKTLSEDYYDKSEVDIKLNQLIDIVYPIGAIYMSVNSTDPSVLFGGVWEQIEGRFLLASGNLTDENDNVLETYVNGDTGGETEHTLSINEMPSHYHSRTTQPQSWSERDSSASQIISPESGSAKRVTKNTSNTGGGQAHNNMPPYLVVNVWERVE